MPPDATPSRDNLEPMNYYEALQRQTDKRWDYTRRNDGQVHAIGYCAGKYDVIRNDASLPHPERYHDDGHATAEEACECYKQYVLDNLTNLEFGLTEDTQHKCEAPGCGAWTQKVAMVDHHPYNLCDDHRNLETLQDLVTVSTSISSY